MYENDKIENVHIDYARMEQERHGRVLDRDGNAYFSFEKVCELLAMACEDVWPDWHYSDVECCMWSEIRRILDRENLKEDV